MAMPDEHNMIDVLVTDHREIESIFAELESGTGTAAHRGQLRDVAIAELIRHAVAEEEYLYPTVRDTLADGGPLADRELAEHAEAELLMKSLEGVEPTDPRFDALAADLIATVRHHMSVEEADLFPLLRRSCTEAQLGLLAGKVEMAKRTAPTRPHPAAPDQPPWNMLLAPGAGLVDRVRDALTGRPTRRDQIDR